MAELKPNFFAQKRDQLVAIAGFSAYSLFFLFFCIGLVNLGGAVFGMTEMFNFFDDPVKYLVDGVFGLIKSLFSEEGNWFEGQGSQLFFIMGSFIAFIVFLVKFIFTELRRDQILVHSITSPMRYNLSVCHRGYRPRRSLPQCRRRYTPH